MKCFFINPHSHAGSKKDLFLIQKGEHTHMPTNFREFTFENRNSISIKLKLEAPVGTPILETEVAAGRPFTFHPNVNDIRDVRITVVAGDEHTDVETLELRGSPFKLFFETLKGSTSIGSIHGVATVAF